MHEAELFVPLRICRTAVNAVIDSSFCLFEQALTTLLVLSALDMNRKNPLSVHRNSTSF